MSAQLAPRHALSARYFIAIALAASLAATRSAAEEPYGIEWIQQFGIFRHDGAFNVTADENGGIYVTGHSRGSLWGTNPQSDASDALLARFNAAGDVLWTRQSTITGVDAAFGISLDGLGSVYITGGTGPRVASARHFLTKYTDLGEFQWRTEDLSPINSPTSVSRAVSADGLGNVYVYGETGPDTDFETAYLAKYDDSGTLLWARDFGAGFTEGNGVFADGLGSVYTTGYDGTGEHDFQANLSKYDAAGELLWTETLNLGVTEGNRNFGSEANGVIGDGMGNLYVVGDFDPTPLQDVSDVDAFLAKYDSAGNHLWNREFRTDAFDIGSALTLDAAGDIYIAGYTGPDLSGEGNHDPFVAKYSPAGDLLWTFEFGTSSYDDAAGIAADGLGNIYVAGQTEGILGDRNMGLSDAYLLKLTPPLSPSLPGDYNNDGTVEQADLDLVLLNWGSELLDPAAAGWLGDLPISAIDQEELDRVLLGWGSSAAVTSAAAVPEPSTLPLSIVATAVVFCLSLATRRLSRTAHLGHGFVVLVLASILHIVPTGAEEPYQIEWIRQFGTDGDDFALDLSSDEQGEIYVPGSMGGRVGSHGLDSDAFLAKYDDMGKLLWIDQFGSTTINEAFGVSLDGLGHVYIAGKWTERVPFGGFTGSFLAKYAEDGQDLWSTEPLASDGSAAYGVAADGLGNIYVVGATPAAIPGFSFEGGSDVYLAKYSADSEILWTTQLTDHANGHAADVAVDNFGNIYITSISSYSPYFSFIAKYDADGEIVWKQQDTPWHTMFNRAIAADGLGNVYVTGDASVDNLYGGPFLAKYDEDGALQWSRTREIDGTVSASGLDVTVDGLGNVFVAGRLQWPNEGFDQSKVDMDGFVDKYNVAGDLLWTLQFGTSEWDSLSGISTDALGNVYLAGRTTGDLAGRNAGGSDIFLVKLTPPLPPSLPGDYNNNGLVEQADLDLVLLNWGSELLDLAAAGWLSDPPSGPIHQQELDKALLHWGNTATEPFAAAAAVPEPSTCHLALTMFALTVVLMSSRRWGRKQPEAQCAVAANYMSLTCCGGELHTRSQLRFRCALRRRTPHCPGQFTTFS